MNDNSDQHIKASINNFKATIDILPVVMAFNQKTLSVLEEKDSYSKTKMRLEKTDKYSIRDFDIFDNKEIVFAGVDGKIYFYDIFNTKTPREAITAFDDIKDRIRKVKFINRDELL